jgi:hypothetical protein
VDRSVNRNLDFEPFVRAQIELITILFAPQALIAESKHCRNFILRIWLKFPPDKRSFGQTETVYDW